MTNSLQRNEEKAVFALRSLYKKYGYLPYKMSKFEEYELYSQNKDFLVSDRVITFNDTNGKLMALKPDVTLSIIKNAEECRGVKSKVYYNENVYRISEDTHQYKEIMQTGLECIGDIGLYDIYEAVLLAAKSLECIGCDFILDISHLDILASVLDSVSEDERFKGEILDFIKEKNTHDIERVCKAYGIEKADTVTLCTLASLYGKLSDIIPVLETLCKGEKAISALSEIKELYSLLLGSGYEEKIYFDFSIVSNMKYYSGIVFKGFIGNIFSGVLSGGRYDRLMHRMGRRSGAIGFALYLDLLEGLEGDTSKYDIDVLLLYDESVSAKEIKDKINELTLEGKSVSAQKTAPEKLRAKEIIRLGEVQA